MSERPSKGEGLSRRDQGRKSRDGREADPGPRKGERPQRSGGRLPSRLGSEERRTGRRGGGAAGPSPARPRGPRQASGSRWCRRRRRTTSPDKTRPDQPPLGLTRAVTEAPAAQRYPRATSSLLLSVGDDPGPEPGPDPRRTSSALRRRRRDGRRQGPGPAHMPAATDHDDEKSDDRKQVPDQTLWTPG